MARDTAIRKGIPLHEAEADIVGCNYAEVGAALAGAWHLSSSFATAIGAQLMPALGGPHVTEAALLHLANLILATDKIVEADEAVLERMDPMSAAVLEMNTERIAAIRARVHEDKAAVIALFFPAYA